MPEKTEGDSVTTFDLRKSAIAGGVVMVMESARKDGGHSPQCYAARIVRLQGSNVRAPQPYKIDAAGHKRPRPTLRRWIIEIEEI